MNMKTMKLSPNLRWVERPALLDFVSGVTTKVLQQASICLEDGSVEWNDVSTVSESNVDSTGQGDGK